MRIIFFGTSEFGAIILENLIQASYSPVLVVTTSDKPAGRKQVLTPPPVKVFAKTHGLEVFQPEKFDKDALYKIQNTSPDLFVVAAYGKILPKALLDIPPKGSLNVHPSLLPKYRGLSPVQAALLNGDQETGVSIIVLDEKMDHGPILAVERLSMQKNYTYSELHNMLAELGGNLLIRTIPLWAEGKIQAKAQDEARATYTKMITWKDGRIDWGKPAEYIERQIRAFNPEPGTYTFYREQVLKIRKAELRDNKLVMREVQLAGKKPMSFEDFLRGHQDYANPQ